MTRTTTRRGPATSAGRNLERAGKQGEAGAKGAEGAFDDLTGAVDDTGSAADDAGGKLGGISGVAGKAALGVAKVIAAAGFAIGTKLVGDLFETTS